jgi:hypothetical protein
MDRHGSASARIANDIVEDVRANRGSRAAVRMATPLPDGSLILPTLSNRQAEPPPRLLITEIHAPVSTDTRRAYHR